MEYNSLSSILKKYNVLSEKHVWIIAYKTSRILEIYKYYVLIKKSPLFNIVINSDGLIFLIPDSADQNQQCKTPIEFEEEADHLKSSNLENAVQEVIRFQNDFESSDPDFVRRNCISQTGPRIYNLEKELVNALGLTLLRAMFNTETDISSQSVHLDILAESENQKSSTTSVDSPQSSGFVYLPNCPQNNLVSEDVIDLLDAMILDEEEYLNYKNNKVNVATQSKTGDTHSHVDEGIESSEEFAFAHESKESHLQFDHMLPNISSLTLNCSERGEQTLLMEDNSTTTTTTSSTSSSFVSSDEEDQQVITIPDIKGCTTLIRLESNVRPNNESSGDNVKLRSGLLSQQVQKRCLELLVNRYYPSFKGDLVALETSLTQELSRLVVFQDLPRAATNANVLSKLLKDNKSTLNDLLDVKGSDCKVETFLPLLDGIYLDETLVDYSVNKDPVLERIKTGRDEPKSKYLLPPQSSQFGNSNDTMTTNFKFNVAPGFSKFCKRKSDSALSVPRERRQISIGTSSKILIKSKFELIEELKHNFPVLKKVEVNQTRTKKVSSSRSGDIVSNLCDELLHRRPSLKKVVSSEINADSTIINYSRRKLPAKNLTPHDRLMEDIRGGARLKTAINTKDKSSPSLYFNDVIKDNNNNLKRFNRFSCQLEHGSDKTIRTAPHFNTVKILTHSGVEIIPKDPIHVSDQNSGIRGANAFKNKTFTKPTAANEDQHQSLARDKMDLNVEKNGGILEQVSRYKASGSSGCLNRSCSLRQVTRLDARSPVVPTIDGANVEPPSNTVDPNSRYVRNNHNRRSLYGNSYSKNYGYNQNSTIHTPPSAHSGATPSTINLNFHEFCAIRKALYASTLEEYFSVDQKLHDSLKAKRVCFECKKSLWTFFGSQASACSVCSKILCQQCYEKIMITPLHLGNISTKSLTPAINNQNQNIDNRSQNFFKSSFNNVHTNSVALHNPNLLITLSEEGPSMTSSPTSPKQICDANLRFHLNKPGGKTPTNLRLPIHEPLLFEGPSHDFKNQSDCSSPNDSFNNPESKNVNNHYGFDEISIISFSTSSSSKTCSSFQSNNSNSKIGQLECVSLTSTNQQMITLNDSGNLKDKTHFRLGKRTSTKKGIAIKKPKHTSLIQNNHHEDHNVITGTPLYECMFDKQSAMSNLPISPRYGTATNANTTTSSSKQFNQTQNDSSFLNRSSNYKLNTSQQTLDHLPVGACAKSNLAATKDTLPNLPIQTCNDCMLILRKSYLITKLAKKN